MSSPNKDEDYYIEVQVVLTDAPDETIETVVTALAACIRDHVEPVTPLWRLVAFVMDHAEGDLDLTTHTTTKLDA